MTNQTNSPTNNNAPTDDLLGMLEHEAGKRGWTLRELLRCLSELYQDDVKRAETEAGSIIDRLMDRSVGRL